MLKMFKQWIVVIFTGYVSVCFVPDRQINFQFIESHWREKTGKLFLTKSVLQVTFATNKSNV
jgi:hypothetical protein